MAQCEGTVSTTDLEAVLGEAEAALAGLEVDSFKALVGAAESMVPCLDQPISPSLAAGLHRLYGIRAMGTRDPVAQRAFAAARYIEPNYAFSKSLIPEGNPVRAAYDQAPFDQRSTDPIERPETGAVYVDGSASDALPVSWPAVVQWVDGDAAVRFSDYLLPGEPLPDYPRWVAPEDPGPGKPPVALVATSIGAGVLSGTLYGVALANEARYKDTVNNPVPDADLDGLRRTTNSLVLASAASGTVALGTGLAIVVAW